MDWHDRIEVDSEILVGRPVIKGTRLAVELIVERMAGGWSVGTCSPPILISCARMCWPRSPSPRRLLLEEDYAAAYKAGS